VVAHAAALVRPGGHVYLVDTDLGAMRLEPDEGAAEIWRRYADFQRTRGNDPEIGPRLHVLLAGAGLGIAAVDAWFSVVSAQQLALGGGGAATAAQHAMVAAGALTENRGTALRRGTRARGRKPAHARVPAAVRGRRAPPWLNGQTRSRTVGPSKLAVADSQYAQ
jgi:hypothetical protein